MINRIHVVVPHYRAVHWLIPCLDCLVQRASRQVPVAIDVLTMEPDPASSALVAAAVGNRARVLRFPVPGVGGQPLPAVLEHGTRLDLEADLTVTVDPDALVVLDCWDLRLVEAFGADPDLVVYGVNPRSDIPEFANVPEWNWMAFRTAFWAEHIGDFSCNKRKLYDLGHIFAQAAQLRGKRQRLWPLRWRPFPGKACSVAGGPHDDVVLHAFYSTRRREDRCADPESAYMLTPEQERLAIEWAIPRTPRPA